jgi:hypothetical protein
MKCPVCNSSKTKNARPDLQPHPYVACCYCGTFYQPEPPPKIFEGAHEQPGNLMSDNDKAVNNNLAKWLCDNWLAGLALPRVLDIGAKYPYLMHCVKKHLPASIVVAIDGIPELPHFGEELGVPVEQLDVEKDEWWQGCGFYDMVTMIHVAEHFYNTYETLDKVQWVMGKAGKMFIRSPMSDVQGVERDFTAGHYSIHPTILCTTSMVVLAERLHANILLNAPMAGCGQADFILQLR